MLFKVVSLVLLSTLPSYAQSVDEPLFGGMLSEEQLFFDNDAQDIQPALAEEPIFDDAPTPENAPYAFEIPVDAPSPYADQTRIEPSESASAPIAQGARTIPVDALKKDTQGVVVFSKEDVDFDADAPVDASERARVSEEVAVAAVKNAPLTPTISSEADVASFGLLVEDTNGFAETLWQGVPYAQISRVFQKVERTGLKSRAAERVLMRMLLSQARPPVGVEGSHWLAQRVRILHALGYGKSAQLLLEGAGVRAIGLEKFVGMPRVWVESALMTSRLDEGCGYVKEHILNSDDPFWKRALLTCHILQEDTQSLALALTAISDDDRRSAPFFYSLVGHITQDMAVPVLRPSQRLAPLESLLYVHKGGTLLQPNVVPLLPDVLLRQVARNFDFPRTVQVQAAEHLVNTYDVRDDVALLGALYDKVEFDEADVASPAVTSIADAQVDGSVARALLWQAANKSGLPSTKALALKALWQRAARDHLFYLPSMLTPNLRGLNPQPSLAWIAPDVMQYALFAGRLESAHAWWRVLTENHAISASLAVRKAWMSIAMSFVDGTLDGALLDDWVQSLNLADDDVRTGVQRVLAQLEAMDIAYDSRVWSRLEPYAGDTADASGTDAGPLWLRMLGSSLDDQNIGRALLLLLEPFTDLEVSDISTQTMGNVVTGYRFLGLRNDAQSFALEAIMPPR